MYEDLISLHNFDYLILFWVFLWNNIYLKKYYRILVSFIVVKLPSVHYTYKRGLKSELE